MGSLLQPSSEPKPAFTQLLDRGLAVDVATACWCPTMDLLALVLRDGQLQVHRLNWQRLWQVTPEAPVTGVPLPVPLPLTPAQPLLQPLFLARAHPALIRSYSILHSLPAHVQRWPGGLTASSWL